MGFWGLYPKTGIAKKILSRKKNECRSIEVNEFLEGTAELLKGLATFTPNQLNKLALTSFYS